jgi:hypothetical protein
MTSEWKPEQYTDQYQKALEKMIEEKIEYGGEEPPVPVPSTHFSGFRQNRGCGVLPQSLL